MKKLARTAVVSAASLALAAAGVVGSAIPANAALEGYRDADYGVILVSSGSGDGYVDVQDNVVSSVKNQTTYRYRGMDGIPEYTLVAFNANTNVRGLAGSQNDNINHFRR